MRGRMDYAELDRSQAAGRGQFEPDMDQVRLNLAIEATGLGIWDWDLLTGRMTWSERAKSIYGFAADELVTFERVRNATHPDDLPRTSAMARRALDPELRAKEPYEYRIILPDGRERWITAHGEAVFTPVDGVEKAVRYTGTVQDITERKRGEEELRLHANLLERMSEGVSLSTSEGVIIYTNPAEDRMFGYAPGELIGQHVGVQNAYPAEENEQRVGAVIAELAERGSWEGEWQNRRKDGSAFVTESRITRVEVGGKPHWLCVQRDATAARQAEEQRAQSEARLRLAIDAARLAVWDFDGSTDTITGSPELNRILGYPADHCLSTAEIRAGYYPGDQQRIRAEGQAALTRGERYLQSEFRYIWPNGEVRWLLLRAELLAAAEGQITRAIGILIDITDQKRTDEALRESEERLELAVRAHRIGIFDWHVPSGRLVWSPQLEELFGLEPGRFAGTLDAWKAQVVPEDAEAMVALLSAAMERREENLDFGYRIHRADGTVRHIDGSGRFLYLPDGTAERMVGVNIDVTERKRAEEHQLLLIGELNHRVKNTLAIVQAIAAQTLRDDAAMPRARMAFVARLGALAEAHDVLTARNWASAQLREVARAASRPHVGADGTRFRVSGPPVDLAPQSAVALTMVLHELCTNAAKYGALSAKDGVVDLAWTVEDEADAAALTITWRESGGPPVDAPGKVGFGSRLIERGWATFGETKTELSYPRDGLVCTMVTRQTGAAPVRGNREW